MSIYNKENSIALLENVPVSGQATSVDHSDHIYQFLKSNTDQTHTFIDGDYEVFEVPAATLNVKKVVNKIRPVISQLRKKADILEVIIHG